MNRYDGEITRRDFVKGTLIGSGAGLLTMPAPLAAGIKGDGVHPWNGYPGVCDYARSNGNTESIRTATQEFTAIEPNRWSMKYLISLDPHLVGVSVPYEYEWLDEKRFE
jgi:hypothetical protein